MKTTIRYEVRTYGEEYAVYSVVDTGFGGTADNFVVKGSFAYCYDMMIKMYEFTSKKV